MMDPFELYNLMVFSIITKFYNHQQSFRKIIVTKNPYTLYLSFPNAPTHLIPKQQLIYFMSLYIFPFQTFYTN